MKLLDFLLKTRMTGSHTIGRFSVAQGFVAINGKAVGLPDLARDGAELKVGDVVTFGHKTLSVTTTKE